MNATFNTLTPNLIVNDVEETVDYYASRLHFIPELSVPNEKGKLQWASMRKDGTELMFQDKASLTTDLPEMENIVIGSGVLLFIRMEGLSQYYDEVREKVDVIKEPHETFYGMMEFAVKDPNGYVVIFAEPVNK